MVEEETVKRVLVVIPARGGSKGIPRKNLRLLGGRPLIYYTITNALNSSYVTDVYVSSEDDEILALSQRFGAKIHRRDPAIADDRTTLDPVIYDTYMYAQNIEGKVYDLIVTLQPTSPLLKTISLDSAISRMLENDRIDTIISVKDATHLSWRKENGRFIPNYKERLNRQYLTPTFTETGGFLITTQQNMHPHSRIGSYVDLFLLHGGEEIDIDTYEDWNLCEYYLKRKHILFVVTGNSVVGLGHVFNTLLLANDILDHQVSFLVDKQSQLAYEKIASKNYPVHQQQAENIIDDILSFSPDVVINDILDTSEAYIKALVSREITVINFEDLGEGSKYADLVINAIYPEKEIIPHHYYGHQYFLLRDEFIYSEPKVNFDNVKNVLVSFGGVDPNNYTKKVLESIYTYCREKSITINVVAGFGYGKYDSLVMYPDVKIHQNISNISDFMSEADVVFTSAGRTIYEIASIGTPAIVMAQNERELSHFFASSEYGFLNMGLGYQLEHKEIFHAFEKLCIHQETREYMSKLMQRTDLKHGRKRVMQLIRAAISQ